MRPLLQSLRLCTHCTGTFCLWTLWLLLGLLAAAQLYLAATREFALPAWALRKLETRLSEKGLRTSIGAARFDLTGHLALYDLKFSPASFKEPLLTAGEIHLMVDPVTLVALHRLDLNSAHAANLTLYLPAQLSPSGRNEPVFDRTNLSLFFENKTTLRLTHLSTKSGPLRLSASATFVLPETQLAEKKDFAVLLDRFIGQYLKTSRDLSRWLAYLEPFENPSLHLALQPDQRVELHLTASRLNLPSGLRLPTKTVQLPAFTTGPLQLRTVVPVDFAQSIPLSVDLEISSLDLPGLAQASQLDLNLRATFDPATGQFHPAAARLTASHARALATAIPLDNLVLQLDPSALPNLTVDLLARLAQTPVALQAETDLATRSASIQLQTEISTPLLTALGSAAKRDLNQLLQPARPAPISLSAHFKPGFQFQSARARLDSGPVIAHHVALDRASGDLFFDGQNLLASDVLLTTGESRAAGSYWMDTRSLDFRLLLEGRLQPAAINGWFTNWWPEFWQNFEFNTPPSANVDVRGRWRSPRDVSVFISVDAPVPRVRTVAFDRVHTTLFVRPHYTEALRLHAFRPEGSAHGTFSRRYDIDAHAMRETRFDLESTVDLAVAPPLFGPEGKENFSPYQLNQSPQISARGTFTGPAHPDGVHQSLDLQLASRGPLAYYQFPISDFNARVTVRDRTVNLKEIHATYAQGKVTGEAEVRGPAADRRLRFDLALLQARFGQANRTLQTYLAHRRNQEPAATLSDFETRTANNLLDLRLAASGPIDNTKAFTGQGQFTLSGELGEINIFGALSRALSSVPIIGASSMQLNHATGTLQLNQARLDLPDLRLTGRSATIKLNGHYRLDTESVDLNAKVYPFESSSNVFSQTFDLVLTPFSHALELKLTGSLADPKWNFVYSPLKIFSTKPAEPAATDSTEPKKN